MRIILDECLPRRLGRERTGHSVTTVPEAGWAGIKNGELLRRIEHAYDAFITVDKNLPSQQPLAARPYGIVVIRAKSNRIRDLKPLAPTILAALATLQPGQVTVVP